MRLIGTLNTLEKGKHFCAYLSQHGIANNCEVKKNTDWGSDDYGNFICHIWIVDEDQVDEAISLLEQFQHDAYDPKFSSEEKGSVLGGDNPVSRISSRWFRNAPLPQRPEQKMGMPITLYIAIFCFWIFVWGRMTAPPYESYPSYLPPTALFSPPVNKQMLFDYPEKYELADQLIDLYGLEKLQSPNDLPLDGKYLLKKYLNTPYWLGFYDKIILSLKEQKNNLEIEAPLFEKIKQGEVWRLFSPCLLHNDIFHLLFNLAWLILLGRQMENRLGPFRYILLMVIAGLITNLAQYFMSGPNFIGYSGILCAMIVFVWFRQKNYPWEGYFLHSSTMRLITVFILIMFGIQFTAFLTEVFVGETFTPGIANTAHMTGAAVGYLCSRVNFFKWTAKA